MPSHTERLARLRAFLAERRLDGLFVSQPESRFYLSGYTGHDLPPRDSAGYLLVTGNQALLLTDPRTAEQAEAEAPVCEVVVYQSGVRATERAAALTRSFGVRRLGFEGAHLPYALWHRLAEALAGSGIELVDASGVVEDLRVVKDAAELTELQAAVDVLDDCFAEVAAHLQPGVTEREVARDVEVYLLRHADGPSFPSIVASGLNGSMPHAVPGARTIREGEGITIDIGARVRGYASDMTRTICLGPPADSRLAEVHALVLEAQACVERQVRPGMTGREADALARGIIQAAGHGEAFTHGTGHGIGLEVHERPSLSRFRGDEVLKPGMVFSVEPGVYLPGWGGVRIEDLVVLEEDGARVLCRSARGLDPKNGMEQQ